MLKSNYFITVYMGDESSWKEARKLDYIQYHTLQYMLGAFVGELGIRGSYNTVHTYEQPYHAAPTVGNYFILADLLLL